MLKYIKPCAIALFGLFTAIPSAQAQEENSRPFKADIRFLASDALEGREVGTEAERQAAAWERIARALERR